jgi:LDH2 family malate/lactate/ureidoglycolate dehydrogenase
MALTAGARTYSADSIRHCVTACVSAAGAHGAAAAAFADAITEAHLRGVETHGLRRLRPYVARMRSGGVNASADPEIVEAGSMLKVDGRNGIGHHVAKCAAEAASKAAAKSGIAIALVRNSNHFGFAGYYATHIAQAGQIAIVTSNGQVFVAPEGRTRALLSNNPLAIAAPLCQPEAFLELDLATSVTSRANIVRAAKEGLPLPPGTAQDKTGRPTADAAAALEGTLLALAGDRGFGLLFALEAITGVLAGGDAYADRVSSKESTPDAPEGTAHTIIAIDLTFAFGTDSYCARLNDMIARLRALPGGPGARPARYPGERRWRLRAQRLRDGIPLEQSDAADLADLAQELGLAPLQPLQ